MAGYEKSTPSEDELKVNENSEVILSEEDMPQEEGDTNIAINHDEMEKEGKAEDKVAPQTKDNFEEKYKASQSEAIKLKKGYDELQTKLTNFQESNSKTEAQSKKLEQDLASLNQRFAEEKPEEYKAHMEDSKYKALEAQIAKTNSQMAEQAEETKLNEFIARTPDAAKHKERLRKLGWIDTNKTYDELYDEVFSSQDDVKPQPESGKNIAVEEPITEEVPSNFGELPLSQQKAILLKKGKL